MDYFRKKQEIGGILLVFCSLNRTSDLRSMVLTRKLKILLVFCSLNRTFARTMTSNSKTNMILALVALALAVLCVMSIVR